MTGVSLQAASRIAPAGLAELLQTLGHGEAGFSGTPVADGTMTLAAYLELCVRNINPATMAPGRVPQTVYWIMQHNRAVGMLRMRHYLNDALRVHGGHIGYYIKPDARRGGAASEALRLALVELAARGETAALLTTNPGNLGSIRVIKNNGGRLTARVPDPDGGDEEICQYWIDLTPGA